MPIVLPISGGTITPRVAISSERFTSDARFSGPISVRESRCLAVTICGATLVVIDFLPNLAADLRGKSFRSRTEVVVEYSVTLARISLQPGPVDNHDVTAAVTNQPGIQQRSGSHRDRGPRHTERV